MIESQTHTKPISQIATKNDQIVKHEELTNKKLEKIEINNLAFEIIQNERSERPVAIILLVPLIMINQLFQGIFCIEPVRWKKEL
jgi:hypothetical protein